MGEFESRVGEAIQELKQRAGQPAGERQTEEAGEPRPEPHELMPRIEQLFEEAQRDRSKALLLKQELDRWGLFSMFEDRFLDLFGRDQRSGPRK
jgi:hypothetical protein